MRAPPGSPVRRSHAVLVPPTPCAWIPKFNNNGQAVMQSPLGTSPYVNWPFSEAVAFEQQLGPPRRVSDFS